MFGLSLPKILLIALLVAALWYGLRAYRRYSQRVAEARRRELESGAESMVKCPVCGAYNPPGIPCSHHRS
jgi:hypothetical protein